MFARHITSRLLEALAESPVVVLHGPRQSGKSTLVRALAKKEHPAEYITLDKLGMLNAARNDPEGFLANLRDRPVVLDEVQRAPDLLLAIKADVDRDRRPGRFLLTGSAHVLQLPRLADSLAGRVQILSLWPLSQGEMEGRREDFIDAVFAEDFRERISDAEHRKGRGKDKSLAERIVAGGYPEAVARKTEQQRRNWFEPYLETILLRDVRDLADIAGIADLPRLLVAAAGRAGGLVNYADLGRDAGLNQVTLKRYLTLLEATFLVRTVRPWFTGRVKRVMKSEKLYLGDSGLLAHVLDTPVDRLKSDTRSLGTLLENFVAVELMKQRTWSETRTELHYFRDYSGMEVDFVLETPGGRHVAGIEVKAAATPRADDFRGLRVLAEAAGKQFCRGIVLYTGQDIIPFGEYLFAVPMDLLWRTQSRGRSTRNKGK